jgi:hypothetical protein
MTITTEILNDAQKDYDFFETPKEHAEYIYTQCKSDYKLNVLDICCGLGGLSKPFYDNDHNITLIELNDNFKQYLQEQYPKATLINKNYLEIDDIPDIDIILCNPPFNTNDIPRIYIYFLIKIMSTMNINAKVYFICPQTVINHNINIEHEVDYWTKQSQSDFIDHYNIYKLYGFIDISLSDLRFNKRIIRDLIDMKIIDKTFFDDNNVIQPYYYIKMLRKINNFKHTKVNCILMSIERG